MNPFDQHGIFERSLEFSSRQVVTSSSRIQFSLSFHKRTELISRKSEFQTLEGKNYTYFSDLLGLRHLQGFYVFDLCKIIIQPFFDLCCPVSRMWQRRVVLARLKACYDMTCWYAGNSCDRGIFLRILVDELLPNRNHVDSIGIEFLGTIRGIIII